MPFLLAGPVMGSSTPIRIVSCALVGASGNPMKTVASSAATMKRRIIGFLPRPEHRLEKATEGEGMQQSLLFLCIRCKNRMPDTEKPALQRSDSEHRRTKAYCGRSWRRTCADAVLRGC